MNLQTFLAQSSQSPELQSIVLTLASGIQKIQEGVSACGMGTAGNGNNASGDEQMELDVFANYILGKELKTNKNVHCYASEEEESIVCLENTGTYAIAFDPLDGSSLINTNLAVGTIFGVYKTRDGFIGKKGKDQMCAGYAVYGPRLTFVFSFGDGVYGFTFNNKEFILTHNRFTVKEDSKYFSPGNLRATQENSNYLKLVTDWMLEQKTLRYSGGMVPDINNIFCKGSGIFAYPGHSKYPNGKLRLLYECAPFAFLAEAAGGLALDQYGNDILGLEIKELHQRTTIFIGSKNEVIRAVKALMEL